MDLHTPDIDRIRDAYRGRRCFVLGNAPSLAETPFERLRGEHVFIVNRGGRAIDFGLDQPAWLVVSDPRTYEAYADEIRETPCLGRFYRADVADLARQLTDGNPESACVLPFRMEPTMDAGGFTTDLRDPLTRGCTVVLDAVQVAFHMGFSEVIILGVELSTDGAQSHFYGTGTYEQSRRTDMPVDLVRASFATARRVFEQAGRRLVNATPGGHLHELERVSFDEVFAHPTKSAKPASTNQSRVRAVVVGDQAKAEPWQAMGYDVELIPAAHSDQGWAKATNAACRRAANQGAAAVVVAGAIASPDPVQSPAALLERARHEVNSPHWIFQPSGDCSTDAVPYLPAPWLSAPLAASNPFDPRYVTPLALAALYLHAASFSHRLPHIAQRHDFTTYAHTRSASIAADARRLAREAVNPRHATDVLQSDATFARWIESLIAFAYNDAWTAHVARVVHHQLKQWHTADRTRIACVGAGSLFRRLVSGMVDDNFAPVCVADDRAESITDTHGVELVHPEDARVRAADAILVTSMNGGAELADRARALVGSRVPIAYIANHTAEHGTPDIRVIVSPSEAECVA